MNNTNYQIAVKEAVKPKFKGKREIAPRVVPRIPASAEREYIRINRAYIRILNQSLKDHLPEIMEAYEKEFRSDSREDGFSDFALKLQEVFFKIAGDIEKKTAKFGLERSIEKVAGMVQRSSIYQWKRMVKDALGVDILEEYYEDGTFGQLNKAWVADNLTRVEHVPVDTMQAIRDAISDGFAQHEPVDTLKERIQKLYDRAKRYVLGLASVQVLKLNSDLSKMEQEDAGVRKYKWWANRDSRTRDSHRNFHGKVFYWDDPPEGWNTNSKGERIYTGRKCNPGEDYGCRCIAIPYFDLETLSIPVANMEVA